MRGQTLDMQSCQLGPFGTDAFIEALSRNTTLTSWNLTNATTGLRGPEKLAKFMRDNRTLLELSFSYVEWQLHPVLA